MKDESAFLSLWGRVAYNKASDAYCGECFKVTTPM